MGWIHFSGWFSLAVGSLALAGAIAFLFAGGPSDMEFLLSRILWGIAVAVGTAYLLYQISGVDAPWTSRGTVAAAAAAFMAAILFAGYWYIEKREIEVTTVLYPGNWPMPAMAAACKPPKRAIVVSAGTNIAWSTKNSFALLKMDGETSIGVTRSGSGPLEITSLMLRDFDRTVIATRDSKAPIWLSPSVRRERPDKSTLIVFNRYGDRVLFLRYLNPSAIEISGNFYGRTGGWVKISDADVDVMTNRFSGGCFGMQGGGTAFVINNMGPVTR